MDEHFNEQKREEIITALKDRGYEYEVRLGRGSYGVAVRAKHDLDGQKYAIKILPIVQGETAKYQKRELDVLTKKCLSQHNIVKYHGCWQIFIGSDPHLCIQMELCLLNLETFVYNNEMGNATIIQSNGPPRFYQQVFPQILKGLCAMHSNGLVHRDIHISNILIAQPKPREINQINIKIADFGLAREIGPILDVSASLSDAPKLQKLSPGVGNELFRAPELETEYYDYKVDLFSAGIVLYFLSRYLEDKKLWRDEILDLRSGKFNKESLFHQDDEILFHLITMLLQEDPKVRLSAEDALKVAWNDIQLEKHEENIVSTEGTRFDIKKDSETTWKRCLTNSWTIGILKNAVECCTGIQTEFQELRQVTTVDGKEEIFTIETDLDVHCMFQSAKEAEKRVAIIVSEKTSEMEIGSRGLTNALP